MRVFVLTKNKFILILSALATSLLVFLFTFGNSFLFANKEKKKLPIYRVKRDDKVVSISFDAAWGNEYTQSLLDTLKKHNVRTTFFLVGMWVDKYPESVKAIFDAGHDIGNHSDTHPHLPKQSKEKIREHALEFDEKVFRKKIKEYVEKVSGVR